MKNLRITQLVILIFFSNSLFSQVAINTDESNPDPSAMLDVKSTNSGVLIPRMSAAERDLIPSPAIGLLVYVTDDDTFYYNSTTGWVAITGGTGSADGDWTISGSDMYSSVPGNVGIGENAPSHKLTINGGNARILGSDGWTAPGHTADLYLGDPYYGIRGVEGEGLRLWAYDDFGTDIRFQNHLGTDLMTIDMYWKSVGIGATNPSDGLGKLQVEGGNYPGIYVSSDNYTAFEATSIAGGGYAVGIFNAAAPNTYGIVVNSSYESIQTHASSNIGIAIKATASNGAYAGIFNGGNVGIGTNNPSNGVLEVDGGDYTAIYASSDTYNTLHVTSDAGGGFAAGIFDANTPDTYGILVSSSYESINTYASSTSGIAIRARAANGAFAGVFEGNVGIGTLLPLNAKLEIEGGSLPALKATSNSSNTIHATANAGGGYAAGFFEATNPGTYGLWTQSDNYDALYAYTSSPSHAAIRATGNSGAYAGIFHGNVGIGTDTPSGKLHAVSTENYPGYFETSFTDLNSHVVHAIYTGGPADAKAVYGESVPADYWGYGGLFLGGFVGVSGVVNPTGGDTYYGIIGNAAGGSGTNYGIYGSATGSGTNYAGYFLGDVTVTGTFTNPSDEKLKTNIKPFENALSKINQLSVHQFEFKTDREAANLNLPNGKQIGFTAQEMEQLFPELVANQVHAYDKNQGIKDMEKDIKSVNYKGINYIGMIPILTQAIKEQQVMIEKQQSQIEELKNMISQIAK